MIMINFVKGGVCAPKGFKAAGIHSGIRKSKSKKDLALIVSDFSASGAAVYTTNIVKAAPILVTKKNLSNGFARAIICNSGIANAAVADGIEKATVMCKLTADNLKIKVQDIIVASTGVIGQSLNLTPIEESLPGLVLHLSTDGSADASEAIMTTDTFSKKVAVSFDVDGYTVTIGGIAKGSGMINPNMATMLGFLTTDAQVASNKLSKMLKTASDTSFNRVSVDGDTSTNDMLAIMANGQSGVKISNKKSVEKFQEGLNAVCIHLAKLIAKDGEGATKLIECTVSGAPSFKIGAKTADSIINSSLVKTAMFGSDANWGRILCAIGYSGAKLDISKVDISFRSSSGEILVCQSGAGVDFSEDKATEVLKQNELVIDVKLNQGKVRVTAWGCDLSYDYVKINGDYRS